MQRLLQPHPTSPPSPVRQIQVDAVRLVDGRVSFVFGATGEMGRVRVPPGEESMRKDGLWRHTCFEAFVQAPKSDAYFEFNFSPSSAWAAYRFDAYRGGMAQPDIANPKIETVMTGVALGLVASVNLGPFSEFIPWEEWRAGLSAVIEAEDGTVSHWALAHPEDKPDFHHRDCFAAVLAPAATL
jgi:hypothetical protein